METPEPAKDKYGNQRHEHYHMMHEKAVFDSIRASVLSHDAS
ncbi:hypothetical protein SPV1_01662 [Mariprofundus ferrooxydans PV-1]|jgi:hypothetical protein|uniref:Uncharacterized protein n=1 Tax=Mariprofundus ferrooxydans PV-1 TaxID=314345 RepID=Q0F2D6_9PROT|nr:hypothetical protein SPV1_01662 [Mariprofundus ferrooxydans PV-1]